MAPGSQNRQPLGVLMPRSHIVSQSVMAIHRTASWLLRWECAQIALFSILTGSDPCTLLTESPPKKEISFQSTLSAVRCSLGSCARCARPDGHIW